MSSLKTPIQWKTDADGIVRGVPMHDASLVEFHCAMNQQSYLIGKDKDISVEIELLGVVDFNLVGFWRGAIVAEAFVWKLAEVPARIWDVSDNAWATLFEGKASITDARRTALRLTETMPNAYLFQLLCSYGGRFAVVCNEIAIYKHTR